MTDLAELTLFMHDRNRFDYDECQHGTYSGGASHGEPYAMCDRQARALIEALPRLGWTPPTTKWVPGKWHELKADEDYEPNQRVSYYRVTGMSDPSPANNLVVGSVLIDKDRGEETDWQFMNMTTGRESGWITGVRLGFAKVDPETMKPVPSPSLQAVLDIMRDTEASKES